MVTYLVGTDGVPASETICAHLEEQVAPGDHLEVMYVVTDDTDAIETGEESFETFEGAGDQPPSGPGADIETGEAALAAFEDRFGDDVSLNARMFNRGRNPADELVSQAREVDADHVVTALRRHSRTERIIFGSVSHSLLQRVTRPITLVPLAEYQPEAAG